MIMVITKAGNMNAQYDIQMSDNELAKFNSQFEIYARYVDKDGDNTDDKYANTIFDVITAVNHAWDINKKNGYDESNCVEIKIQKNNGTIIYNLPCSQDVEKAHIVEGSDENGEQVYIYDLAKTDLYGETKSNEDASKEIYHYIFNVEPDGITYNETTGKVSSVTFILTENHNF